MNIENDGFTEAIVKYPGVFVIDAHQQGNGYFFPPNEDAVHHEVSQFAIDFIQNDIGPILQRMFNDQTVAYQNYNVYDLFAPIYGDSVPALLDGAAGMTYEKGSSEVYGKQVYDHYLAMDATQNVTSDQKVQVLDGWVRQWGEARQQGAECQLQMNKLVSPLHTQIFDQPNAVGLRVLLPARPELRRHGAADRRADRASACTSTSSTPRSTPPACIRSASASTRRTRRRASRRCPRARSTCRWTRARSTGSRRSSARTRTCRTRTTTTSCSGRTRSRAASPAAAS